MEQLLFFALILAAFYLLIIRPQRTRARQAAQMQARLAPGVEVVTTAGLFGTVAEVHDDAVLLEVSPGVTLRFLKGAIGRVVTADDTAGDGGGTAEGGADGSATDTSRNPGE